MTGFGILPVVPAIVGDWPFQGFPDEVSIGGVAYNLATWASPFKSGVVAQYRAAAPTNALHLCVYRDGQYVIDHADEWNPDAGYVLEHALVDAPLSSAIAAAVLGGAAGFAIGMLMLD